MSEVIAVTFVVSMVLYIAYYRMDYGRTGIRGIEHYRIVVMRGGAHLS